MKFIENGNRSFARRRAIGVVTAIAALTLIVFAGASVYPTGSNTPSQYLSSYTDNGLTCSLPVGSPPYLDYLVPKLTQSSEFLSLANGAPYVLGNTENMTNRWEAIHATTYQLPPVVEMVFYTYGPNTHCGETGPGATSLIVVHAPIENGVFNLQAATFHLSQHVR